MLKFKDLVSIAGVLLLLTFFSCASTTKAGPKKIVGLSLGDVIVRSADEIALKIPPLSRIALMRIDTPDELAPAVKTALMAALKQVRLEAAAPESIEYVRRENGLEEPAAGKAGLKSTQLIATQAAVQYYLTGQLAKSGSRYNFSLKLTNLTTGKDELSLKWNPINDSLEITPPEDDPVGAPVADEPVPPPKPPAPREGTPPSAGNYLDQALTAALQGETDAAMGHFLKGLEQNSDYLWAYYWRAYINSQNDDTTLVISDYVQVARLAPANLTAYVNLGLLYTAKGDYNRAIDAYTQAIRIEPRNPKHYNSRGVAYALMDQASLAIADFTQVIKIDSKNTAAYTYRAEEYAAEADADRALRDFNQAIKLDPQYAAAYRGRGKLHSDNGEYEKAVDDYSQAISLEPDYAETYTLRGNLYLRQLSSQKKAIADFTEAVRLEPGNQRYRQNLKAARTMRVR
ncbi:hypothetical protein AGMMS49928_18590 [Spirochaetia bacterium]|nr:hypothetical protein AGMMS49928_18590 [Spirochaetia bacterium]